MRLALAKKFKLNGKGNKEWEKMMSRQDDGQEENILEDLNFDQLLEYIDREIEMKKSGLVKDYS